MMEKLYAERLLQVVRVLEELPEEKKFDLETWCVCRTKACAVGWAASDPWFMRRGLRLKKDEAPIEGRQYYIPSYRKYKEMAAASVFFRITDEEACLLFSPSRYPSNMRGKRNVIRRIKAFVKANT